MQNFMQDEFVVENDSNPWNNKKTEDFLRHLKCEYHTIIYPAAFIFVEGVLGFERDGTGTYGPHDAMPVKVFYAICLVPRAFNLLCLLYFGWHNINWASDTFKM